MQLLGRLGQSSALSSEYLRGCLRVVPPLFLSIDCNDFCVQGLESDSGTEFDPVT